MSASFTTFDGAAFIKDFRKVMDQALMASAKKIPLDQTHRIETRLTPDGQRQKANAPKTRKAKIKRLGHDIPLRDQGILANPSLYSVKKIKAGYQVRLPSSRDKVVFKKLVERGYKYWGISKEIVVFLSDAISMGLDHMASRAQSYAKEQK